MQREYRILAIVLAILAFLNLIVKPYINMRAALTVVKTVLVNWQNRDLLKAIEQWEDQKKYRNVYSLKSYKIKKKKIFREKHKDNALIQVELYFDPGNVLPSGAQWYFALQKGRFGWKIVDFNSTNPELAKQFKKLPLALQSKNEQNLDKFNSLPPTLPKVEKNLPAQEDDGIRYLTVPAAVDN